MRFQVVVGNIGTIEDTDSLTRATYRFDEYCRLSASGYGRVAGESVTLFDEGELVREQPRALERALTEEQTQMSDATRNRARFLAEYTTALARACAEHPDEYAFPPQQAGQVAEKMLAGFLAKTASNHGRAIKATCRMLGIKPTYKSIYEYLGAE